MPASGNPLPAEASAESLRDAFSQTHNAIQWLARIVQSFRNVSGTNDFVLSWDEKRNSFLTDEFAPGLQMELRLPHLTLQFLEDGKPVKHELQLEGRSPAQVEAWILVELLHRGVDRDRFSKNLPYEVPNQMAGDSVEYSPEFREGELKQIVDWFAHATALLKFLAKQAAEKRSAVSDVVLRARDLSLEVSIPPAGQSGTDDARNLRVGFCPLRQGIVDPHYFVAKLDPSKKSSDIIEIVKVSSTSGSEIGSTKVAKRLTGVIEKMQKRAAQ